MKTLALVLVLLVAVIAGLGFYRGWFSLASKSADAESKITLTVDKDKIQEDRTAATESVENLGSSAEDTISDEEDKTVTTP